MRRTTWLYVLLLTGLATCVERYTPELVGVSTDLLVVEGILQSKTTLTLSRTSRLESPTVTPVLGALVWVENENQTYKVFLAGSPGGKYAGNLSMQETEKYRLGFTIGTRQYYSEFVQVNNSPEIKAVTWAVAQDGNIEIYVSTKNTNERSRYYRWNYTETWEYFSEYESILKYQNGQLLIRSPQEQIHRCYKTRISPEIIIGSTTSLVENTVSGFAVRSLDPEKNTQLDNRYSILVKQYALSKDAFEFWEIMQKNTQNLGTLFGPQPSQLRSNIYSTTDPGETVIGFISAGDATEKRIFIDNSELPDVGRYSRYPNCKIDTVDNNANAIRLILSTPTYLPITSVGVYTPTGYLYSPSACVDCRLDGGVLQRPDFWE